MAIQTPIESLPLFLQQIFRERGVYPELNTGVDQSSSVNSFVPPRRRRLNAEGGMEGDFDEPLLPESTGSVDIINTLRGLFSSEDPYDPEANMYYSLQENQTSLGSSFLDGVKNISDTIGKEVTEDLTKGLNSLTNLGSTLTNELSGLFSLDGLSDLFSLDSLIGSAPSIEDRYGPTGFIDAGLTALRDPYLSTDRKVGQIIGGVLGAGASSVIPGANILGLFGAAMGRMGAHHDFNSSRDYNLNFDLDSGRFEWDSLEPGGGGVQYGELSNTNMVEDIASKNPNYEINISYTDPITGDRSTNHISAGLFNDLYQNRELYQADNPDFNPFDAIIDSADSGPSFGSQSGLGYSTNLEDMIDYDAGMGGAIWNSVAGSTYAQGGGYNDIRDVAEAARASYDLGVAPTQKAIDAAVDSYLSGGGSTGGEAWDASTIALASDPNLDMSMGDLGGGDSGGGSFDFDMGDMGFGEGDFGTDGLI